MRKLIINTLASVLSLSLYAQSGNDLLTYSGEYVLRTGEIPFISIDEQNNRVQAVYHYYTDNDGKRIRQGECSYNYDNFVVKGQYLNGKKDGRWEFKKASGGKFGFCEYRGDILDGDFSLKYSVEGITYIATAKLENGTIVDTLKIRSDSTIFDAHFNNIGIADGIWKVASENSIYTDYYEFKDGLYISHVVYDNSRGEKENKYIADISSIEKLEADFADLYKFEYTRDFPVFTPNCFKVLSEQLVNRLPSFELNKYIQLHEISLETQIKTINNNFNERRRFIADSLDYISNRLNDSLGCVKNEHQRICDFKQSVANFALGLNSTMEPGQINEFRCDDAFCELITPQNKKFTEKIVSYIEVASGIAYVCDSGSLLMGIPVNKKNRDVLLVYDKEQNSYVLYCLQKKAAKKANTYLSSLTLDEFGINELHELESKQKEINEVITSIANQKNRLTKELSEQETQQIQAIKYRWRKTHLSDAFDAGETSESADLDKEIPYQLVEIKPSFNGGDANEFSIWVNQRLRYPEIARENGIQGRVTLQFTIEKDGSVSNVKVIRGVAPSLDREAVRVVSSSPKWKPGTDNEEAVRVTYTFPVIFQLR